MQNYNIRQGEQSDLSWTAKILEAGIDEGHFSKLLKNNSAPLIKAIINKDEIKFVGMRGKIDSTQRYNFDLLIAELNNIAVSFLVLKISMPQFFARFLLSVNYLSTPVKRAIKCN